jgi:hypothetical protein
LCDACGLAYEPAEEELRSFQPLTADITSSLPAPKADIRYLAVWRFGVGIEGEVTSDGAAFLRREAGAEMQRDLAADLAWERIRRLTAPQSPWLYVPAFALQRPVVQQLGVSLVEAQPALALKPGLPAQPSGQGALSLAGSCSPEPGPPSSEPVSGPLDPPRFAFISPVVFSRADAEALAHFVYLALEAHSAREVRAVEYHLTMREAELVFLPAVWDPRYVHEANWRLLLHEFDGIAA